tara:strand:- start:6 stop:680 length:675 start_codon:yes stop_codon:yes gene_type:complete
MTSTTARIKKAGKPFEILVDLEKALAFRKGESSAVDFLEADSIFSDSKKGEHASSEDIKKSFGTEDISEVAGKIVKGGEVLVSQEHRDAEQEKRFKQVVDLLSKSAVDPQTGNPHTPERIKSALEQAHINVKPGSVENQMKEIIEAVSKVIPLKLETKKVKIGIPAIHTGQAYGVVNQYKDSEQWLEDGSLEVIVKVPSGMIMDFYDRLNSITHGSAVTEEIKE